MVSRGCAGLAGAGGAGTEPGQVLLCLALLWGSAAGAEERVGGIWGVPEQQLPADPLLAPAPPGQGKRRMGLA